MRPELHILQNGVPRSGNVWLYNQVRRCLVEAGVEVRQNVDSDPVALALRERDLGVRHVAEVDFINIGTLKLFYSILDVYKWPIDDIDAYVASTTQAASHSSWTTLSADIYRRFSHVLYVVRDPRDVALSLARFAFTPFNLRMRPHGFDRPAQYLDHGLRESIHAWVTHIQSHLAYRPEYHGHVIFYERMLSDPIGELRRIADFLGLQLDDAALAGVAGATNLPAMQNQQPNHTGKGGWGGWREQLSRPQKALVEKLAGPLLAHLGYPVDAAEAESWTPEALRLDA
ncbi:MAG: sulfotransferase domain-containing protein [Chromatiales bacterium]|nr:sulfotransferase domain-containing protein [Chromatiales bacterium]